MGISRTDDVSDNERYGSIFLICRRHNGVCDLGAADEADAPKLANIPGLAPGSTCLYDTGRIDRLNLTEWVTISGGSGNG
jgi:hypothetical protein